MKSTIEALFFSLFVLLLTISNLSGCTKKYDSNTNNNQPPVNTITPTLTVDFSISTGIGHTLLVVIVRNYNFSIRLVYIDV